jgi:hypothetical protein
VLPVAARKGIAVLGMKSLGGDAQPVLHGVITTEEGLPEPGATPTVAAVSGNPA